MDPFFPTSTNIDSSNPIISLSDLAAWDFTSLEDNPEAQKFLIDAIVSNDQYRDDDDQKRKLETLGDIIQQLPSKAIHNLNIDSVPHPELTLDEMIELGTQSSFEDLQAELLNEPLKKKKAGRKPLTTTPNSKRKAQNRAAQRAFRERKERYVQELEDKIKELESVSAKSNHENEQLKSLSTLFTFSTPANDDTSTSTTGNNSGGLTNSEDPFTPPSSNESDNESNTSSNRSANGSKNSPAKVFVVNMGLSETPSELPIKGSKTITDITNNTKEFCAKFTDGICLEDGQSSIVNDNSNKSTSAFTEYRDPTPFTPNIDNLFAGATPLAPLFEEHFINLGSFAPMSTPSEERVNPFMGDIVHNNGFATFDDLQNKSFLSCNKVWEKIQQHPMFDELEDEEIDQLCAELKSKARCSGHGPVVPEEEVDAALIKLEEK
ncbi:22624_t:CDS:2 [Entrophospora sp. SA101]|nr:22624_t:CDS:2 [Entrophospora sp. SA101]